MHLDMTVDQEIASETIRFGVTPTLLTLIPLNLGGKQQYRGSGSSHYKRLGRADAPYVNLLIGEPPPLGMWMEIVPVHPQVEVENVPAEFLSRFRQNGRRVTNEGS